MANTKLKDDAWKLESIKLEFQNWGEDKGKYMGQIRFKGGLYESFSFRIKPDMAQPYIDLIADDIVDGAQRLGHRLIESLGLFKEEPKE